MPEPKGGWKQINSHPGYNPVMELSIFDAPDVHPVEVMRHNLSIGSDPYGFTKPI